MYFTFWFKWGAFYNNVMSIQRNQSNCIFLYNDQIKKCLSTVKESLPFLALKKPLPIKQQKLENLIKNIRKFSPRIVARHLDSEGLVWEHSRVSLKVYAYVGDYRLCCLKWPEGTPKSQKSIQVWSKYEWHLNIEDQSTTFWPGWTDITQN